MACICSLIDLARAPPGQLVMHRPPARTPEPGDKPGSCDSPSNSSFSWLLDLVRTHNAWLLIPRLNSSRPAAVLGIVSPSALDSTVAECGSPFSSLAAGCRGWEGKAETTPPPRRGAQPSTAKQLLVVKYR